MRPLWSWNTWLMILLGSLSLVVKSLPVWANAPTVINSIAKRIFRFMDVVKCSKFIKVRASLPKFAPQGGMFGGTLLCSLPTPLRGGVPGKGGGVFTSLRKGMEKKPKTFINVSFFFLFVYFSPFLRYFSAYKTPKTKYM